MYEHINNLCKLSRLISIFMPINITLLSLSKHICTPMYVNNISKESYTRKHTNSCAASLLPYTCLQ